MTASALPVSPAATALRTAGLLRRWLGALQVFVGIAGGLCAVALLVFGVLLLAGSSLIPLGELSRADLAGKTGLLAVGAVMLLIGLLYGVSVAIALYLLGWARDWETHSAALATGQGGDPARLAALRATLGKWISFSQWGMVAYFALLVVVVIAGGGTLGHFMATDPSAGSDAAFIGPLIGGIYALMLLFIGAPVCVLNWLILAAIRRFMDAATDRLLGAATPLKASASTVSNWMIFLLVIIGLGALNVLASVPLGLLGAFLPDSSSAPMDPAARGWLTGIVGVSGLLGLAVYALYFMLVLWSRSFAVSLAELLDGRLDSGLAAPVQPPVPPLG